MNYKFTITGIDQCGDEVVMQVAVSGSYAKAFVAACRRFFQVYIGGQIVTASIGIKI